MNDLYKQYVTSFETSSSRARSALYLVVLTSTMLAMVLWNIRPGNWDQRLIERLAGVIKFRGLTAGEVAAKDLVLFDRAKAYAEMRGIPWKPWSIPVGNDPIRVKLLAELEDVQKRNLDAFRYIEVRGLGVRFQPNDIGLVGGFAMFVMLMVLRFSLARESANLGLIVDRASKMRQVGTMYDILSMGQVLSVPPTLSHRLPAQVSKKITICWNCLPLSLFLFPCVVQSGSVLMHLFTFRHGWLICHWNSSMELAASVILWLGMLGLTVSCVQTARATQQHWESLKARAERSDESVFAQREVANEPDDPTETIVLNAPVKNPRKKR
jgi:hypothetical protein